MLCSPHTVVVVVCSPTNGAYNIIDLVNLGNIRLQQVTTQTMGTQPRNGHNDCARTTGLRAEIVYGGDIQSIVTDH